MKKAFYFLIFIFNSCGGTAPLPEFSFSESKGTAAQAQLNFSDFHTPSQAEAAAITHYKIVVEKEGAPVWEQTLSQEAQGLSLRNLPAGKIRRVRVLALNGRGQVLREGVLENIEIRPGSLRSLSIELKAVPIFLNVAEGEYVSNRRLFLRLFSDPGHRLVVESGGVLVDEISGSDQIPTNNKGEAVFYSTRFGAGPLTLTVRDLETEKFSQVTLQLWEGKNIAGAPLLSASQTKAPMGNALRLGQSVVRKGSAKSGELFPNIAEILWQSR